MGRGGGCVWFGCVVAVKEGSSHLNMTSMSLPSLLAWVGRANQDGGRIINRVADVRLIRANESNTRLLSGSARRWCNVLGGGSRQGWLLGGGVAPWSVSGGIRGLPCTHACRPQCPIHTPDTITGVLTADAEGFGPFISHSSAPAGKVANSLRTFIQADATVSAVINHIQAIAPNSMPSSILSPFSYLRSVFQKARLRTAQLFQEWNVSKLPCLFLMLGNCPFTQGVHLISRMWLKRCHSSLVLLCEDSYISISSMGRLKGCTFSERGDAPLLLQPVLLCLRPSGGARSRPGALAPATLLPGDRCRAPGPATAGFPLLAVATGAAGGLGRPATGVGARVRGTAPPLLRDLQGRGVAGAACPLRPVTRLGGGLQGGAGVPGRWCVWPAALGILFCKAPEWRGGGGPCRAGRVLGMRLCRQ